MPEKIRGKIITNSSKGAVLLKIISNDHMAGKEVWIPISSIWWPKNYTIEICISDKIAKEKGFISDEECNKRIESDTKENNKSRQGNIPF